MTAAMTSDDVETMVNLFAPDAKWVALRSGRVAPTNLPGP